jgi:hypothetical protein
MKREDIDRLEEIRDEIKELLDEATGILRRGGGITYERARSYWLAHIRTALDKDHDYLGGSMVTMQNTIDELGEDDN